MTRFRGLCVAALAAGLISSAGSALAQSDRCTTLMNEYEFMEKRHSDILARSSVETNVARLTLYETEASNVFLRQSIVINMMVAQQCELPAQPPNTARYLDQALRCLEARLESQRARSSTAAIPACDQRSWTSSR